MTMVIPTISHRTWERTRGLAQIAMGTDKVAAETLSFSKQLELLLEPEPGWYSERIEATEEGDFYHTGYPDGEKVQIQPDERERPHRPELSEELLERLREQVDGEYYGVPAEALATDKLIELVLDKVEEYYAHLDCYLIEARNL